MVHRPSTQPLLLTVLLACTPVMAAGLAPECSGVPGDLRTPNAKAPRGEATHGPGRKNAPAKIELADPATLKMRPGTVYVFDENADHVVPGHAKRKLLSGGAFEVAEDRGYWVEGFGGEIDFIPHWDKCTIASHLPPTFSFRAPEGGLLFVQFGTTCTDCVSVSRDITAVIEGNPHMPVRWLQTDVPEPAAK